MGKRTPPSSIDHLTKALSGLPMRIERAILFGSRARGDWMEHSDWDVVLISRDFEGIPFHHRAIPLLQTSPVTDVEMFCYTPAEFEKGRDGLGIIGVAVKEGIELKVNNTVEVGDGAGTQAKRTHLD